MAFTTNRVYLYVILGLLSFVGVFIVYMMHIMDYDDMSSDILLDTNYDNSNNNDNNNNNYKISFNSSLPYLIFQIGFNKCGTTSLLQLFKKNNIKSIHYFHYQLHLKMRKRYINKELILSDFQPFGYKFYADFSVYIYDEQLELILPLTTFNRTKYMLSKPDLYMTFYNAFYNDYPETDYNLFFILNIRNVNHWLKSRYIFPHSPHKKLRKKINNVDIVYIWRSIWYKYICDLLKFFKNKNIMHKLLIFDIENDKIDKLINFFTKYNITLNKEYYTNGFPSPHINNSVEQEWREIEIKYPEFVTKNKKKYHEFDQLQNICFSSNTVDNLITDSFQKYIIKKRNTNETFIYKSPINPITN